MLQCNNRDQNHCLHKEEEGGKNAAEGAVHDKNNANEESGGPNDSEVVKSSAGYY